VGTMFGVGIGEVRPVDTVPKKLFTIFVIIGGTSSVVFVIGEVIRFITEGEIMKAIGHLKTNKQVSVITKHAIVCGYGRIGQILAHELAAANFPFVVIDLDDSRLAMAEKSGYLFVKGSATEEETLERAQVERAVVLATVLPQDTLNVYITLTARNLNRKLRIIARGELASAERKLIQAGADEVILPASIGGLRIAHSITRKNTMAFLGDRRCLVGDDLKHLGVEIDELRLHSRTALIGKTVAEIQGLSEGHLLVIALLRADGSVIRQDFLPLVTREGDALIIIGRVNDLPPALREQVDRAELL
jgi:voltage-gated potassium channel